MNKKVKIIILAAAVILLAGAAVAYAFLPHALNYDISSVPEVGSLLTVTEKTEDEVTVSKSGPDFKVLFFTDTHLDGKNKTSSVTVRYLVENVVREKPDLVIFNGDNVTSAFNAKRCRQLGEIFEKLGVYWAGGLGNHEGDNRFSVSRSKMMKIFMSFDHCLMLTGKEDLPGDFNYALNVLNTDGSLKHTYFFMDTGDEMSAADEAAFGVPDDGKTHYDGTKPEQVAWYAEKNAALKERYGDFCSTVVIHIPLPQMKTAAETGEFLYGDKREGVCASAFDSGLFAAMQNGGTAKAAFFGHDHINDFGLEIDGILLTYLQPSGYGSYTAESRLGYEEKDWLQGCTVVKINEDGNFDFMKYRNAAAQN